MPLLGGITSFLDKYILGYALGTAAGPALRPFVQDLANEAWTLNPVMRVDPITAAAVVAEDVRLRDWGAAEALNHGIDGERFDAIVGETLNAPSLGTLYELWRRNFITRAQFEHGLRKAKLEGEWDSALEQARVAVLAPAQIALAIVRGLIPDPGILPVGPPSGSGKVPAFPVFNVDAEKEAFAAGIDLEHLSALVGSIGLPMSAQQAASAAFRSIIDRTDFDRAISEGDIRNEWRDAIYEQARQIPTAHDGIEDHLRGWTDAAAMYAQTARHGMSKADTDLLFRITGRPLSFHQVFIGERRGGTFNGGTAAIDPAFLKSLQESNIRPEWYDLAWAQRHTLPSAFVLRALLQGGVITAAQGEGYFLDIGWPPALAKQVADFYGAGTAAKADPHVSKAQTQLWTTLHRSYLAGESTQAEVSAALPRAGVSAAAISDVLATWDEERAIIRKQLSPAQVKKAYVEGVLNPDTGAAWTKDEATAGLVARGYSTADATTFLEL